MPRDSKVYLEDILAAARKVRTYTAGMTRERFSADEKTIDAVVRNLEVIGEAARSVPEVVRQKAEGIDWRKIVGLRDVLIHQYFGLDLEILWDIVSTKLPDLEKSVVNLLQELEGDSRAGQ